MRPTLREQEVLRLEVPVHHIHRVAVVHHRHNCSHHLLANGRVGGDGNGGKSLGRSAGPVLPCSFSISINTVHQNVFLCYTKTLTA